MFYYLFSQNIKTLCSRSLRCFSPPGSTNTHRTECQFYIWQPRKEFSVKWDVMLHRGVPVPQAVLLDFTDSSRPPIHLLSPRPFFLSLSHFLPLPPPTWREPPFPPHHIHFYLAISPMNKKINKKKTQNHAENLLFLIIARR